MLIEELRFQLITSCKQLVVIRSPLLTDMEYCDAMFACTILHCELYNSADIAIS